MLVKWISVADVFFIMFFAAKCIIYITRYREKIQTINHTHVKYSILIQNKSLSKTMFECFTYLWCANFTVSFSPCLEPKSLHSSKIFRYILFNVAISNQIYTSVLHLTFCKKNEHISCKTDHRSLGSFTV